MTEDTVNLAEECGELPSGSDLARGCPPALTLSIEGVLSLERGLGWAVRVEKPTTTPSGRRGKPRPVLMLVADEGQTIPDLLRAVATCWDQGEVALTR